MEHINLDIIKKFFDAYSRHDMEDIRLVLSENVKWIFPGQNSLSGTKSGIDEVIEFFDRMGSVMGKSGVEVKKLVMGLNDDYVLECQYIRTNRKDGVNIDQEMCVLWTFKDEKIAEGKHFTSEQLQADAFFNLIDSI